MAVVALASDERRSFMLNLQTRRDRKMLMPRPANVPRMGPSMQCHSRPLKKTFSIEVDVAVEAGKASLDPRVCARWHSEPFVAEAAEAVGVVEEGVAQRRGAPRHPRAKAAAVAVEAVAIVDEAVLVGVDSRPHAACCAPLALVVGREAVPVGLNARAVEEGEGERELAAHEGRKLVKGRERL
eukprot:CAMPEP_0177542892 /NCGR_PEP_ID=MMETSP0369-20130122/61068_1 /TAXON_ID=447022 ORGANISM="Scrippsiella hangoei-like, Strain SHHI-4" /NCGR_SAMPLE_ID=MMETSP0369 /ASSEMBLY_ACC=CAM_ASM_000364 /LENGTH=182 /DNA_ID=CAMNT_0019026631 /DNA_START=94 /DNA_END=639 /DNA_ORIENTATION=-